MVKQVSTPIELEIRKLGLSEKEARVYLACLELGKTSVQNIAKKAGLSRPTAYRTIESLREKELIEKPRKKSANIIARSPDELLGVLRVEKRKVEEKEREFIRIISRLKSRHAGADKNEIKIFSGKEGKKFLYEELSATNANKIYVINSDSDKEKELEGIFQKIKKRIGKLDVIKINSPKYFKGTLITSDKIIYFKNNQSFVIEQDDIVEMFKNLMDFA